MRIRTLTLGLTIRSVEELITSIDKLWFHVKELSNHLISKGYEVQTLRICTNSFEEWLIPCHKNSYDPISQDECDMNDFDKNLQLIKDTCNNHDIHFLGVGPATLVGADYISVILKELPFASTSIKIPPIWDELHEKYIKKASLVCYKELAENDTLSNFRFCASFNTQPGIPFFPVAYWYSRHHSSCTDQEILHYKKFGVTVGLECSDLLVEAFVHKSASKDSLSHKEKVFYEYANERIKSIENEICSFIKKMNSLSSNYPLKYHGIDTSMNPSLEEEHSLVHAYESVLGHGNFGSIGTLAISSLITKVMRKIDLQLKSGYCGLMLPVMEDKLLAERAVENKYTIKDLLMWSSVCGVGIDTVPVSLFSDSTKNDSNGEERTNNLHRIEMLYSDIAALAFKLNKPLSCRILPIPRISGESTNGLLDSPFLTNTRIFKI